MTILSLIEMPAEKLARFSDREYRQMFVAGRRFRVVVASRLTGMKPIAPNCQQGWGMDLPPGTILTCAGESMTYGDGVPAVKWYDAEGKHLANDCIFQYDQLHGDSMWGGCAPSRGRVLPLYRPDEEMPRPLSRKTFHTVKIVAHVTSVEEPDLEVLQDIICENLGDAIHGWTHTSVDKPIHRIIEGEVAAKLIGRAIPGVDAEGRETDG